MSDTLEIIIAYVAAAFVVMFVSGAVEAAYHRWWWARHGRAEIDRIHRICREANERAERH